MTVQLRAPVKTDFSLLAALRNDESIQRQLMIEAFVYSDVEVEAWIRRRTHDPQGAFWVVDADGPRGFVQLTQIQSGSADLGICLEANVRGKGVATEAMRLLVMEARQRGCRKLTLRVLRVNHRAIAFYRKLKFSTVDLKRRLHFDGRHWRDVLFMEKRLR